MKAFFLNPFTPERYQQCEQSRYSTGVMRDGDRFTVAMVDNADWEEFQKAVAEAAELKTSVGAKDAEIAELKTPKKTGK